MGFASMQAPRSPPKPAQSPNQSSFETRRTRGKIWAELQVGNEPRAWTCLSSSLAPSQAWTCRRTPASTARRWGRSLSSPACNAKAVPRAAKVSLAGAHQGSGTEMPRGNNRSWSHPPQAGRTLLQVRVCFSLPSCCTAVLRATNSWCLSSPRQRPVGAG